MTRDKPRVSSFQTSPDGDQTEVDRYGCCGGSPSCLQFLNTIQWFVVWQCMIGFIKGFVVPGVISAILPTLEKRYNMSSSRSSVIASAIDIGSVVLYLFVGYLGENTHKPRIVTLGGLFMALGSFVLLLPHYIGGEYKYSTESAVNQSLNLCYTDINTSDVKTTTAGGDLPAYTGLYITFIIGQICLGIGCVPLYTLSITYMDENCKTKMTPFYIGMISFSGALGVSVGYITAGQSLRLFVDVDIGGNPGSDLDPSDSAWVGAWWVGILIGLVSFAIVIIPLSGYPAKLPGYAELQKDRKSEAHNDQMDNKKEKTKATGVSRILPPGFTTLIRNPTFVCLVLGSTLANFQIAGLSTFGTKIISEAYNVDLGLAGTLFGVLSTIGSAGGMILGGYVVKRYQLACSGVIRFMSACTFIGMLLAPAFIASCPQAPLHGVTDRPYGLVESCNSACHCNTIDYRPVCNNMGVVYFSPCHAGCSEMDVMSGEKIYHKCSCLGTHGNTSEDTTITGNATLPGQTNMAENITAYVKDGNCSHRCVWFYVFCVLLVFHMFFTFLTFPTNITALLRCVTHNQRSLAQAVYMIFARVAGAIPGYILLGAIIDSTCEVWQESNDTSGSCWVYDTSSLGIRLAIWWGILKCLQLISYLIAGRVYKPPKGNDGTSNKPGLETNDDGESVSTRL